MDTNLATKGPDSPDATVELVIANDMAEIDRLTAAIHLFLEGRGIPETVQYAIDLSLEEVITNILKYGYDDTGRHTIHVALTLEAAAARLVIEDDGHAFDPLAAPEPDISKPIEERSIGGLGLFLVRSIAESVHYQRVDGLNRLDIRIRLAPIAD